MNHDKVSAILMILLHKMDFEDFLFLIGSISMMIWALSTLLFARTSVKYVQKEARKRGFTSLESDSGGWGYHIADAATLIRRSKPGDGYLSDFIRPYDKVLAIIVDYSFFTAMAFGALHYLIFEVVF